MAVATTTSASVGSTRSTPLPANLAVTHTPTTAMVVGMAGRRKPEVTLGVDRPRDGHASTTNRPANRPTRPPRRSPALSRHPGGIVGRQAAQARGGCTREDHQPDEGAEQHADQSLQPSDDRPRGQPHHRGRDRGPCQRGGTEPGTGRRPDGRPGGRAGHRPPARWSWRPLRRWRPSAGRGRRRSPMSTTAAVGDDRRARGRICPKPVHDRRPAGTPSGTKR